MKKPVRYISVDVEADGPCPGLYSMISLGAVLIDRLDYTFYGEMAPLPEAGHDPKAAAVGGFAREQQERFPSPLWTMRDFWTWLSFAAPNGERLQFVSDNAGFDWQFVNYYLLAFTPSNPFGFSPFSLTSAYKGFARSMKADFRRDGLRVGKHDHNALNDAIANAKAFLEFQRRGFKV